jgi:ribulose-bisphosphate carboxylase small chain
MRLTQGTFSFLPDLTDEQIAAQVQYFLDNEWAVSLEYTDDPHPRNIYWEMWAQPMFDLVSVLPFMDELQKCREAWLSHYVRISAFDNRKGWESLRSMFIVQRPEIEPGFRLERTVAAGRSMTYATRAYAADRPVGERYQ